MARRVGVDLKIVDGFAAGCRTKQRGTQFSPTSPFTELFKVSPIQPASSTPGRIGRSALSNASIAIPVRT
jgi:hypothetical protein